MRVAEKLDWKWLTALLQANNRLDKLLDKHATAVLSFGTKRQNVLVYGWLICT
jgi:hypothetical protein